MDTYWFEFTQCVGRTHSTIAILVRNLFYPPSHLSSFFLIFPFNSFIYILFLHEIRHLGFPYLLFLCFFSPHRHRFNFQTESTAPFNSMVLVRLELFLCLHSLFISLKRCLMFYDTVYCICLPVWISV